MFGKPHTDVLVVGAGPVGLFSALCLGQHHVGVHLIDEEWRAGAHSYALALHPHSLELLEAAGVLPAILAGGLRIDTIAFYDGKERKAEVSLGAGRFPFLLVAPQNLVEMQLQTRLAEQGIRVQWEQRLSQFEVGEKSVMATIDELGKESSGYATASMDWVTEATRGLEAGFVIGADGHRSKVRRLLDVPFEKAGETEFYAVFEFESSHELPQEARIVLDEQTANVYWPLSKHACRWSLQFSAGEIPRESRIKSRMVMQVGSQIYPYLTQRELVEYLGKRAPWFDAPVRSITWSLGVRFERSLARRFGRGRVYLTGDAAHLAGPIGMQSMNGGLDEAHALAVGISRVLHEEAPLTELEETAARHQELWRALQGLEAHLAPTAETAPWVARRAGRLLHCLPATSLSGLEAMASQLHLQVERASAQQA